MKYFAIVVLLGGMCWGQTNDTWGNTSCHVEGEKIKCPVPIDQPFVFHEQADSEVSESGCKTIIRVGRREKSIQELFPEECAKFAKPAPANPGPGLKSYSICASALCEPEPIDVPAIQETRPDPIAGVPCAAPSVSLTDCMTRSKDAIIQVTTCTDKARILQHDEDSPARWWCHRVQP
jgi:hypothetical protein